MNDITYIQILFVLFYSLRHIFVSFFLIKIKRFKVMSSPHENLRFRIVIKTNLIIFH